MLYSYLQAKELELYKNYACSVSLEIIFYFTTLYEKIYFVQGKLRGDTFPFSFLQVKAQSSIVLHSVGGASVHRELCRKHCLKIFGHAEITILSVCQFSSANF